MANYKQSSAITSKFPIEVPLHEVYSHPCIFKVHFGKDRFYIGKGKSLLQACELMSTMLERSLRTGNNDPADWFFHVVNYINRAGIKRAKAEMLFDGYELPESMVLIEEQKLLSKNRDNDNCLNNTFDAYIPAWLPRDQVEIFKNWKDETNKRNRSKNRTTNSRKKHKRR